MGLRVEREGGGGGGFGVKLSGREAGVGGDGAVDVGDLPVAERRREVWKGGGWGIITEGNKSVLETEF